MLEKLIVVITNSDPRNGCEIIEPIFNATVAASMDYKVEVILSGRSGEIAIKGVADEIISVADESKTVYDLIKDAHAAGVVFKVTKHLTTCWGTELIPEVSDTVGAGYLISEIMDSGTKNLTY